MGHVSLTEIVVLLITAKSNRLSHTEPVRTFYNSGSCELKSGHAQAMALPMALPIAMHGAVLHCDARLEQRHQIDDSRAEAPGL